MNSAAEVRPSSRADSASGVELALGTDATAIQGLDLASEFESTGLVSGLGCDSRSISNSPSVLGTEISGFPVAEEFRCLPAALGELERRMLAVLEIYSNVHRGTGQHSEFTTALFERARQVVLERLGLDKRRYVVIFCSPQGANELGAHLSPEQYRVLSSQEYRLPLGVRVLAVERKSLPKGLPPQAGGGTVRLIWLDAAIWADAPERFEAGTPAIFNAIATVCALQLSEQFGAEAFRARPAAALSVQEVLYRDGLGEVKGLELLLALRDAVIGGRRQVPVDIGETPYINLDSAASTPTLLPVWETVQRALVQPSPVRREIVREVKRIAAEFLGAPVDRYSVVFTSNTTEAVNAVASHLAGNIPGDVEPVVLNTWLEHNSNELPWRRIPGVSVVKVAVDDEGFIDHEELENLLAAYNLRHEYGRQRIVLVAVSGASNVLGTFNDVESISRIVHRYGSRLLLDAAQMVAHRRIEMEKWDLDYLAFSGHKMYAPFGSGALVLRSDFVGRDPMIWERVKACGEENLVGIAAIGKAMLLLRRIGLDVLETEERRLTRHLLQGLARVPGIEIWGVRDLDSPRMLQRGGIVSFSLLGVPHNRVARELAEQGGIGVRSGCLCAHLLVQRILKLGSDGSPNGAFLLRMFPRFLGAMLPGFVRISFGIQNDERDVEALLRTLEKIVGKPSTRIDRLLAKHHNGTPFVRRTEVSRRIAAESTELCGWVLGNLEQQSTNQ